jgi:hypothetical protein
VASVIFVKYSAVIIFVFFVCEELDGLAVSALGVRSRKLSNALNGCGS